MIVEEKLMRYVLFQKRSESEVRRKCKQLKYEEEYTDEVIAYLKEAGYIDDSLYVKKYIRNIQQLKHKSKSEIRFDLLNRGLSQDLIDSALETEEMDEYEKKSAEYLIQKKIRIGEDTEKIKRFLLNKGYRYSIVSEAIDNCCEMNDNEDNELL